MRFTLQAGRAGIRIPIEETNFPLLHSVQTDSGADSSSYSLGAVVLYWGQNGWGVKLATHFHLASKLIMGMPTFLLPLFCYWFVTGRCFLSVPEIFKILTALEPNSLNLNVFWNPRKVKTY